MSQFVVHLSLRRIGCAAFALASAVGAVVVTSQSASAAPPFVQTVAGGNGAGAAATQLAFPYSVAVDSNFNVYVADTNNHRIQRWAPGDTSGVTVAGGNGQGSAANQLRFPNGVAVDSNFNVYVADTNNHRIQQWAPGATSGVTVAGGNGPGSQANRLNFPYGVAVDSGFNLNARFSVNSNTSNVNVYVADTNNHRFQQWAPGATSGVTVAGGNLAGSAANQLRFPHAVTTDPYGNVYVADTNNNRIQQWTFPYSTGVTVAGGNGAGPLANQLSFPNGVAITSFGYSATLYIADTNNHRVQQWFSGDTSGQTVAGGNGAGSASNQLRSPSGVAIDFFGDLYVADTNNSRVQRVGTGIS